MPLTPAVTTTRPEDQASGGGADDTRPVVAIVSHIVAHYRVPLYRALARSTRYRFVFFGSPDALDGIEAFTGDGQVTVHPLRWRRFDRWMVLSGYGAALRRLSPAAVIVIGNPRILTSWWIAIAGRMRGRRVLFWAHGWLRRRHGVGGVVRNLYFGLAHRLLVYADRAGDLAAASRFARGRLTPVYNSLDWPGAEREFAKLGPADVVRVRAELGVAQGAALLFCTARLTRQCRFDLAIRACAQRAEDGRPAHLVLVGDGPERGPLQDLAADLGVTVTFTGAMYGEAQLAPLIHAADACVSPGKVGLSAIHSLSYGTPVITHGDLDRQMPEVEAIVDGETGMFFARDDVTALAAAIDRVVQDPRPRELVRARCRAAVEARYTPDRQRERFEEALDLVFKRASSEP